MPCIWAFLNSLRQDLLVAGGSDPFSRQIDPDWVAIDKSLLFAFISLFYVAQCLHGRLLTHHLSASSSQLPAVGQGVEKQVSGRQPRRAAFWKAQHMANM
jgi:hypothetical protein